MIALNRINITARDSAGKLFWWNHQSGSWQENWGTQCDFQDSHIAYNTRHAILAQQRFLDADEQMHDIEVKEVS